MKDRIGIAVVGLGRISKTHIDGIRLNHDIARLVAVVDIDESLAKSTAQVNRAKFYTSVETALKDPDIQAMVICLPHHLHKPVALQIMEAGRHVLVEKPMATNLADGQEMVDKAMKTGMVLMSGQSFRFLSTCLETKRRMKDDIGTPFNFVYTEACNFSRDSAPPWWRDVKKTGGLAFTMLGSHTVDMTVWMYEGKKPKRIYSEARALNPDFEGMDEIVITMTFDDGSMATNHLSLNTYPERFDALLAGPKGSIIITQARTAVLGVWSSELFINGKLVISGEQRPHNFALQMKEFVEAISNKKEPMVKPHEILTQLAILDAARKSAETHQPVLLDRS